ncbi:hypothetical protein BHE74_00017987 [Ensete ventricosum]|nr:hypothetical protein BHE74_00017987 [Ensete ventricosum]
MEELEGQNRPIGGAYFTTPSPRLSHSRHSPSIPLSPTAEGERFDGDPPVSPSFDPAAPAARGRRLPAAGDGVEGRCPGRHLLHNVRLLRQPLPARSSSSSPAAVTVHHRLPSAAVLHARHVLLLLPSAALRLHLAPAPFRRRLLLPSPDQHLLQGAAAAQPLPTLLPILLLQPSPSLKLLLRCRPLPKSLVPLPLFFHSSPLRLPPVGVPFHNYPPKRPSRSDQDTISICGSNFRFPNMYSVDTICNLVIL